MLTSTRYLSNSSISYFNIPNSSKERKNDLPPGKDSKNVDIILGVRTQHSDRITTQNRTILVEAT